MFSWLADDYALLLFTCILFFLFLFWYIFIYPRARAKLCSRDRYSLRMRGGQENSMVKKKKKTGNAFKSKGNRFHSCQISQSCEYIDVHCESPKGSISPSPLDHEKGILASCTILQEQNSTEHPSHLPTLVSLSWITAVGWAAVGALS